MLPFENFTVDHFAYLFNCKLVGGVRLDGLYSLRWSGPELFMSVSRPLGDQLVVLFCSSNCQPKQRFGDLLVSQLVVSVQSSSLLYYRLYVLFICCS